MSASQKTGDYDWDLVIKPKGKGKSFVLGELLRYRDLLLLFVKRDFIALYKQTILGPIWIVIQPILTTITFYIVFSRIASIDTGVPAIPFYMLGITVWTYFADCVIKTSDTFIVNQNIFGKVYFPRLIVPLSIVLTNLIKFCIQFLIFILIYLYYLWIEDYPFDFSWQIVLIPVLLLILACLGLGVGLIISSLTTKYRDLRFLIQFAIQLAMYATPIVWPLTLIAEDVQWKVLINPMAGIIETFKAGFFGPLNGTFSWWQLGYSGLVALIILFIGIRIFSRIEKTFMDTI